MNIYYIEGDYQKYTDTETLTPFAVTVCCDNFTTAIKMVRGVYTDADLKLVKKLHSNVLVQGKHNAKTTKSD